MWGLIEPHSGLYCCIRVGFESHSDYTAVFMWSLNLTQTILRYSCGAEPHLDYTDVFMWGLSLNRDYTAVFMFGLNLTRTILLYSCRV